MRYHVWAESTQNNSMLPFAAIDVGELLIVCDVFGLNVVVVRPAVVKN